MKRKITTVLIVPQTLLREGLARLLSSTDYKPVRCVTCVDELTHGPALEGEKVLFIISRDACAKVTDHDAPLPEVQLLKQHYPDARLIVLSDTFNVDDVVATLRAGANGYIMNTMTSDALIKSLDLVMFGETVLASEFSRAVCEWRRPPLEIAAPRATPGPVQVIPADLQQRADSHSDARRLSSREAAILSRLMLGESNKNIARSIGVAEATVKTHIKAILRKIRVKNRTQAAMWAFTNLQSPPRSPLETGPTISLSNGSIKLREMNGK